jgi:nucleotide-binding universal stress UspA family protein
MERTVQHLGPIDRPFRTVIVGVDEQQGGRDATALATELLSHDGALTLAYVSLISHDLPPVSDSVSLPSRHRLPAGARGGEVDIDQVRRIEASSVGRGLHELACAQEADLLVVGSCRRSLVGRVLIEDDTRDALSGAPCAIAIAPFGFADQPAALDKIGVAYNASPESEDALAVARALAVQHGSTLSAFQAVSIPYYMTVPGAGTVIASPPALVDEALARIVALGDLEAHAAYGVPAEELAVYSASLDLLVVGSRGYGPVGQLVHGSTSRQLARTARCPLLVLTRDARARLRDVDHAGRAPVTASIG